MQSVCPMCGCIIEVKDEEIQKVMQETGLTLEQMKTQGAWLCDPCAAKHAAECNCGTSQPKTDRYPCYG